MEHVSQYQPPLAQADVSAFKVWLSRTLKTSHEGAVHEPIPAELLALLPPASSKDR